MLCVSTYVFSKMLLKNYNACRGDMSSTMLDVHSLCGAASICLVNINMKGSQMLT